MCLVSASCGHCLIQVVHEVGREEHSVLCETGLAGDTGNTVEWSRVVFIHQLFQRDQIVGFPSDEPENLLVELKHVLLLGGIHDKRPLPNGVWVSAFPSPLFGPNCDQLRVGVLVDDADLCRGGERFLSGAF